MAEGGGGNAFNYGGYTGSWRIVETGLFRDQGRYTQQISEALRRTNVKLAADLQKEVAQALRQGLKRPGVSTGMLERTLLDQANVRAVDTGFTVGVIDFLDREGPQWDGRTGRVWEQIEKGTDVHEGKKLVGLWADAISASGVSYETGIFNSQRNLDGDPTGMGKGAGQGFRPFAPAGARMVLRKARQTGSFVGIIREPIRAEEYFKRGWEQFGGMRTVQAAYEELFRGLGIKVKWVNGKLTRG